MGAWSLEQAMAEVRARANQPGFCPRAVVTCALYSAGGSLLASGINSRYDAHVKPCDCNTDPVSTLAGASSTCLAQHAEITALLLAAGTGGWSKLHTAVVSRAPCKSCLVSLLASPVQVLAVSRDWPDRDGVEAVWKAEGRIWRWMD